MFWAHFSVELAEEPQRNEDEIDLDSSDDDDVVSSAPPNMVDHLQSLLHKMDGSDKPKVEEPETLDEPELEKISDDEESDDDSKPAIDFNS